MWFCSLRAFEFEMYRWRSPAALLQDGLSLVGSSNRLVRQSNVIAKVACSDFDVLFAASQLFE